MAKIKVFKGREYKFVKGYLDEEYAYQMADYWRKGGHNARVVITSGKRKYELYITEKIR